MGQGSVSVLMTVYNGSRYLRDALKSVLNQTFADFEFLIVDDYSSDDSCEIVRSQKDSRIHLYRNPQNVGQTKSLNVGLNLAKGKYVARMDSDDVALPGWLKAQVDFGEAHPGYTVISTKAMVIDGKNKTRKLLRSSSLWAEIVLRSFTSSPINHVGALMDREVILKAGGYDEQFKIAADYALWSKLIREGYKITTTDQVGVAIRVHESSVSMTEKGKKDFSEMTKIILLNLQNLTTLNASLQEASLLWYLFYDLASLTREQFIFAKEILEKYYTHLRESFNVPLETCQEILREQLLRIDVKRIFIGVKRNDVEEVRFICRERLTRWGGDTLFSFILWTSLLGTGILGNLPKFYTRLAQWEAKARVKENFENG